VFNVVWTGSVFPYLRLFTSSLMDRSAARFRFVANGCPPDQVALMEEFRERHAGRVVEVLDVSAEMVAHGVALDRVRAQRDDGPHFCLVDPDIKANGPWVDAFAALVVDHVAVTSGTEVWSDDNLVPEGWVGVAGEHFVDRAGFVFGSPHLALYQRAALDATARRWGIGLGSAGPELSEGAKARLAEMGHEYIVYDTAKLVNALLQADGGTLVHRDLPQLVHIGGLAHYLAPPGYVIDDDGTEVPDWKRYAIQEDRYAVTRHAALCLRAGMDGDELPAAPSDLAPAMEAKLARVTAEVADLVERYRDW